MGQDLRICPQCPCHVHEWKWLRGLRGEEKDDTEEEEIFGRDNGRTGTRGVLRGSRGHENLRKDLKQAAIKYFYIFYTNLSQ